MFLEQSREGRYGGGFRRFSQEQTGSSDEVYTSVKQEATLVVWLLAPCRFLPPVSYET